MMDDFANAGTDDTDRFCLRDLQIHRCQRLGISEIVVCPACGYIDTAEQMALHPVTYQHPVIWRALALVARGAGRSGRGDTAAPWPGPVPVVVVVDAPAIRDERNRALELLRQLEHGVAAGYINDGGCPVCGSFLTRGGCHTNDCELAALLREVPA